MFLFRFFNVLLLFLLFISSTALGIDLSTERDNSQRITAQFQGGRLMLSGLSTNNRHVFVNLQTGEISGGKNLRRFMCCQTQVGNEKRTCLLFLLTEEEVRYFMTSSEQKPARHNPLEIFLSNTDTSVIYTLLKLSLSKELQIPTMDHPGKLAAPATHFCLALSSTANHSDITFLQTRYTRDTANRIRVYFTLPETSASASVSQ